MATSREMRPRLDSAWETMPIPEISEPCFTNMVTRVVITTVDMNLGK